MTKVFLVTSIAILFFSCISNKKNQAMDCAIEKVSVKENDIDFIISNSKTMQHITELISNRKKDLIKFKPRYWVEIVGSDCSLKFGVQKNFIKIDGVSYVLNEDLEEIISESLHKKEN